jgi:K+ transporter
MLRSATLYLPIIDDRRDRRVGELIGVLWVLSLADLGFTLWAQWFTPFKEMNPIAALLLKNGMVSSLVLMKVLLTTIGATVFWRLRKHVQAEAALWGMVGVYVALTFRWSDYTLGAGMM